MNFRPHQDNASPHVRLFSFSPYPKKNILCSLALCSVSLVAFSHESHAQTIIDQGSSREANSLPSGDVTNNGTITVSGGSPTINNTISGTGGLYQTSGGTTTITANDTYSGTTNISTGNLSLTGNGSLANSNVFATWGKNVNISGVSGSSTSFKSLAGTSTLILGDKTLTITGASAQEGNISYLSQSSNNQDINSGTYRGYTQASKGGLTIAGGTQALYGYNKDYSGDTTINKDATLLLGPLMNDSVMGQGSTSKGLLTNSAIVNSGTVRTFIPTGALKSNTTMVQNQSITNTSTGVLDLGDDLNAKGGITNNGGSVTLRDNAQTTSITNTDGSIKLSTGAQVAGSIESYGDKSSSITLDSNSAVRNRVYIQNGNITLTDHSVVQNGITNKNGSTYVSNVSTIGGSIDNTNGDVVLNKGTTFSITNKNGNISLTQSASYGSVSNENGNITLQDSSQAQDITNSGDNTTVTLNNSTATSLTGSGKDSHVTLNKGTVDGVLKSTNGAVSLQNGSQVGSIDSSGEHASVSLDNSISKGAVKNENGDISLQNGSQAQDVTNSGDNTTVTLNNSTAKSLTGSGKDSHVTLNKGTVDGVLKSTNGAVSLQNGSQVGSIDSSGEHASVSLDNSTSKGAVKNENGDISLQNGSQAQDVTNSGDNTTVTLNNSTATSLTSSGKDSHVTLNKGTVDGVLKSINGAVSLQNGSQVGSIDSSGEHASVSLDNSTSKGAVKNENGDVTFINKSSAGGDLTNKNGNISLNQQSSVAGTLSNENGNITLQDSSRAQDVTNSGDNTTVTLDNSTATSLTGSGKDSHVTLNQGSVDGVLKSTNGVVSLQNGSYVGSIDSSGEHASVSLDDSLSDNDIKNENGDVTLRNGSQAQNVTNSGDNTTVTLNNSTAKSLTGSGKDSHVTLNKGTVDGVLKSTNGAVSLQNGSQVGSIDSSGEHASVSLDNSTSKGAVKNENGDVTFINKSSAGGDLTNKNGNISLNQQSSVAGTLSNENGNITLQNGSQAQDVTSSYGSTSITQGSSVASLSLDHVNLALDNAAVNGTLSVHNTDNSLKVGSQGASINTLDMLNGSFRSKDLQGDLSINSMKGNFDNFSGSDHNITIKDANGYGLTLAYNNTYSQKEFVNNGTVSVGNGTTSGVITGNLSVDNGHIIINNAADSTQSGTISGSSDLTQNSNTATTFTGDNSYTGDTTVNAGSLEIEGNQSAATGQTFVTGNANLSGQGTIGGSVSMTDRSILTPGSSSNPLGTLTINKDLTMDKGSTLVINAVSQSTGNTIKDDDGKTYNRQQGSSVHVNGTASFNGNNFHLHISGDPLLRYGQAYVIATSDKPINVSNLKEAEKNIIANSNLIQHSSFVTPVLKNIEDPVLALVGERNGRSFAEAGTTRNTIATGFVMNDLSMNQPIAQAFAAMSLEEARSHLGAFSGEVHASVRTALIQDSVYVRQAALDRLDGADCDGSPSNGISTASLKTGRKTNACLSNEPVLWGRALGSLGHNSGDGNASTMHHSTAGFVMGLDAPVYDTWRVGGMISYGHSMFNIGSGLSSSGRSDNVSIGAYAGRHWGNLHLRLGAAYTWNIMGMHRTAMAGSYSDRLSSNYMGGTAQGFGELAYKLHLGQKSLIEPFANVAYVNQQTDSYREHGGAAALAGKAMNTGVTFATFGARASTNVKIGRTLFTPHGSVAYRHAFGLTTPTVHQNFASSGARTGMSVGGVPLSQDSAVVDTGISAKLSDRINVDLSYIGQYGNQSVDSGAQASVKTSF